MDMYAVIDYETPAIDSFSNFDEYIISPYYDEKIALDMMRREEIEKSYYKYVIRSKENIREQFISKIEAEIESMEENKKFDKDVKYATINYLKEVKEINENYESSLEEIDYMMSKVGAKFEQQKK